MGISILFPVIAQMILTFALLLWVGYVRNEAIKARAVTLSGIAVDSSRWPDNVRKIANCYSNQFELPVIFYVLCLMALMTAKADLLMVVLAWAFVATRIVHAVIHTGSNRVLRRGGVFAIGMIILMVMTGILLVRLSTGL